MVKNFIICLIIPVLFFGCYTSKSYIHGSNESDEIINQASLKANLEFLASDALEGREAGTRGEELAALFITSELKKYGVQPFYGDTSYFQNMNLRYSTFSDECELNLINNKGQNIKQFVYGSEFVGSTYYLTENDTTTSLVFAGYGITADEYNYDDYANIDVAGKYVLILAGEPPSEDTAYFAGTKNTSYANSRHKIRNAKDHNAAGIIMPSLFEKEFGWDRLVNYVKKGKVKLDNYSEDDEKPKSDSKFTLLYVNENSQKEIMQFGKFSFEKVNEIFEKEGEMPVYAFENQVQVSMKIDDSRVEKAHNILAIIEGNDPVLKNEYIAIGAHYDHEGKTERGVYNGADDNGSGTVALMEVAKAFAATRENKRSIFISFFTAEEKGLLGSKYLVKNLDILNNIKAHINLDMIGRGSADTIYSIGSDKLSSELKEIVENVNASNEKFYLNYKFDDPTDPQRLYYRSDHYNFAKNDIPVVFFFDYQMEDYHKPTDDVEKINFEKVRRVAKLTYGIALHVANLNHKLKVDKLASQ